MDDEKEEKNVELRKDEREDREDPSRLDVPVIPAEVINFFSDTQGKTLLVKGPPGTGIPQGGV